MNRKFGSVATLRLKLEDQAHYCDQMSIRDQILKAKLETVSDRLRMSMSIGDQILKAKLANGVRQTYDCPFPLG